MQQKKTNTSNRILQLALPLIKEKGFHSVTIKEIADAANVSEMTVFRHFETKKGIVEAAIERNTFIPAFKQAFDQKIVGDLEQDLLLIAQAYLDLMLKNESICSIAIQERTTMPEIINLISDNTEKLKSYITNYFHRMQKNGKMIQTDAYAQASMFLATLFSYFISTALWDGKFINTSKEDFIKNSVKTFCYGIKK